MDFSKIQENNKVIIYLKCLFWFLESVVTYFMLSWKPKQRGKMNDACSGKEREILTCHNNYNNYYYFYGDQSTIFYYCYRSIKKNKRSDIVVSGIYSSLPFMASCMLNKASLVTEAVATVLPHAVEVSLVFPVTTMVVTTIFIESKTVNKETRKFLNL